MIVSGYIVSLLYAAVCILIAVIVGKFGVPKQYTRKIVHILVGFEWVILTHFFGTGSLHFLAVCLICLTLLFAEYKLKPLPAISSESDNAPGTVYYAVAMSVMALITIFVPNMIYPFGIGVFCTSFGDGFAAIVGRLIRKHNPKIFGNKTLFGAITNLVISFFVPFAFSFIFYLPLAIYHCLLIAAVSCVLEIFSTRGLDNVFITLGTAFLSYVFMY